MTGRVVARLGLALLVVLAGVAGPMSGSAAAEVTFSTDCDSREVAMYGMYNVINPGTSCGIYENGVDSADETDAYASALAAIDQEEAYHTTRSNLNQDVRGLMWMEAKAAAIRALENGGNESEMQAAFNEALDNTTSRLIRNDMRRQSANSQHVKYLAAQVGATNSSAGSSAYYYAAVGNYTFKLPDGTNETMQTAVTGDGRAVWNNGDLTSTATYDKQGMYLSQNSGKSWTAGTLELVSKSSEFGQSNAGWIYAADNTAPLVNAEGEFVSPGKTERMSNSIQDYLIAADQVRANGAQWTNESYQLYQDGNITGADLWDPVTLASEASTSYEDTGYYSFANTELSALGLTGATNVSHTVETTITESEFVSSTNTTNGTYQNTAYNATIEGTIFISGKDSLSLNTGTEYNPANLGGTVYMTVASATDRDTGDPINGTGRLVEIANPFTITEAINTNSGEVVNTTTAEGDNYETTNASRLEEQIDRLIAERNAYEEAILSMESSGGSAAPTAESSLFGDLADWLGLTSGITAALLIGGAYVVLRRN